MKIITTTFFLIFLIFNIFPQKRAGGQEKIVNEIFGSNSGVTVNAGLSAWGPEFTLGGMYNSTYGEWYFAYHLFDYESDEQLWNKPTSGGWLLGFNIIFNYATESRFKYIVGIGSQLLKERLGKEAYHSSGDPTEGSFQGYEAHAGIRYFLTKKLFLSGWVGIFFTQDKSNTMLEKKPQYGITEEFGIITLDLSAMYEF